MIMINEPQNGVSLPVAHVGCVGLMWLATFILPRVFQLIVIYTQLLTQVSLVLSKLCSFVFASSDSFSSENFRVKFLQVKLFIIMALILMYKGRGLRVA